MDRQLKIIATGATSFVGRSAVRELLLRGHTVCAVVREGSSKRDLLKVDGKFPEALTMVERDLGRLDELPDELGTDWDVFLHMGWRGAGSGSRGQAGIQEESALDALAAVRAAKKLGCKRFLFTGSQAEYGVHDCLMDEETACLPTSPYGEAKLKVRREAETLCRALGMDYGHVRIFSTYGPGDHPWSLVSSCLAAFLAGERIELSACTQKWNFLYIDDAGRALADLTEYRGNLMKEGCVYNLGGPMEETGSLRGFVEQMYELCGRKGSFQYGLRPPNAEGVVNLNPDIRKLMRVTGWCPEVRFAEGIISCLKKIVGCQIPERRLE